MNRQTWTMIILAFALGASGCGDSGPDPGTASPRTTDAALLDADGKVGCLAVTAYAADNTEDMAAEVTPRSGSSVPGRRARSSRRPARPRSGRPDFASDVEALAAYNRLSARGVRVISLTQR